MSNGLPLTAADAKRLVENLLGDLRTLSTEAKKKQVQVKEVKFRFLTALYFCFSCCFSQEFVCFNWVI